MSILDNMFVKKAMKSMMTPEQFTTVQSFMTAVQSGKIDQTKLKKVGDKVSKLSPEEVNNLLDLIDKNLK
jgi:hypothetical protein